MRATLGSAGAGALGQEIWEAANPSAVVTTILFNRVCMLCVGLNPVLYERQLSRAVYMVRHPFCCLPAAAFWGVKE